jgi:hypothetical protein
VVGVGLDDDRAAGGERARGVAAGDGEGEGEVGGRVDGDDAQRHLVAAQVRDRRGRGVVGVVDDHVEEGALVDDVREGPQLVAGAGEFAGEPDRAERGLRVGGLDQVVLGRFELVGGAAQEGRADRTVGEEPRAACAARTAASTSWAVASTATCSRCFPVRGSTLQTGAAATAGPSRCNAAVLWSFTRVFDMLNAVSDDEYALGDYFPSNEGVKGDVGRRDRRRSTGQVRGADG